MKSGLFLEILQELYPVDPEQIHKALKYQKKYGGRVGEILLHSGTVSEEQVSRVLSEQFEIPFLDERLKSAQTFDLSPLKEISPDWFLFNQIVPLTLKGNNMYMLIHDPLNTYPMEAVRRIYQPHQVHFYLCEERKFRDFVNRFKARYLKPEESLFSDLEVENIMDLTEEAPVIKYVNSMLNRAADSDASDIHIENQHNRVIVRYRIDGVLHNIDTVPENIAPAVISRIKILSNLDIGESRLPQDGRANKKVAGRNYDIRVSTLPSIHGENIVMRLLEKESLDYEIESLGLESEDVNKVNRLIAHNYGILLVTGPTGSGKSTTLYSILKKLNTQERKIITVEDPVEYQIKGITQVNVKSKIGLSFANVLRNILRQDPDIVMIGEIRDRDTAKIAVHASLTGHLVLATLHTNDAISAITRLVDMGVEDYLINSSLLGVIAQRLVRRVCPDCAKKVTLNSRQYKDFSLEDLLAAHPGLKLNFQRGEGCYDCLNTGYRGRLGVFEILEYSEKLKSLFLQSKNYDTIKRELQEEKFEFLREDAVLKAIRGKTTLEEVLRVT